VTIRSLESGLVGPYPDQSGDIPEHWPTPRLMRMDVSAYALSDELVVALPSKD
jgi:hypothetical protein